MSLAETDRHLLMFGRRVEEDEMAELTTESDQWLVEAGLLEIEPKGRETYAPAVEAYDLDEPRLGLPGRRETSDQYYARTYGRALTYEETAARLALIIRGIKDRPAYHKARDGVVRPLAGETEPDTQIIERLRPSLIELAARRRVAKVGRVPMGEVVELPTAGPEIVEAAA